MHLTQACIYCCTPVSDIFSEKTSAPVGFLNYTSTSFQGLLPDVRQRYSHILLMWYAPGCSLKILSSVQQIVQVEGLRGLFVGVVPRVGRRGLQQAFSWTIFEEVARLVDGRM
ncbi:unnamed protein product [Calypogeia fissa]